MHFLTVAYCFAAALFASATPLIARQNGYGFYQLVQADGSCLIPSVPDVEIVNGTPVIAGECLGYWIMSIQTPTSIVYDDTTFCLDAGSDPANGVGMKLWECFDGLFQQTWYQTADNRTAIYNGDQCLDLALGSTTFVQTWQCTTGDIQQEWVAVPVHEN